MFKKIYLKPISLHPGLATSLVCLIFSYTGGDLLDSQNSDMGSTELIWSYRAGILAHLYSLGPGPGNLRPLISDGYLKKMKSVI